MNMIKKFLMIKGIEIFCDSASTRILRFVFPDIDPLVILNGLGPVARITASDALTKGVPSEMIEQ